MTVFAVACGGGDADDETAAPVATEPTGTRVSFDLSADLKDAAHVFDFPYPSDLRLNAQGGPEVTGFPNPAKLALIEGLRPAAAARQGFPMLPVAYFRFTGPLAPRDIEAPIAGEAASPILLIDVDPTSDERGRMIPTVATVIGEDDYVPANVLGVAARPGFVLRPKRTYAFVVRTTLGDATGAPLAVPLALSALAAGRTPAGGDKAAALYAPLWETLKTKGVDASSVAAATVFTTGDVVADLAQLADKVMAARDVTISDLAVDPDDGAAHPRYCEIVGKVKYPQFQKGKPPYDTEGLFELGADGLPIVQREEEAPITITLPKTAMPAGGFPLATYFHGSGGLSSAVVDRGTWHPETDPSKCPKHPGDDKDPKVRFDTWNKLTGCNVKGEGPAHVLAPFGIAMAASALPVNPERLPNASETAYLNLNNLAAFRDTFRQGVLEQRLFVEALLSITIPPDVVKTCAGLSLPPGETAFHFRADPVMVQGQSMGGMYTNLIAATDPRVKIAVPTGAGGYWSFFITKTNLFPDVARKIAVLLATPKTEMTFMHPGLHLFETAVEAIDPVVFMPRVAKRPLPGHPVRPIYEPAGKDDSYFPTVLYDAVALAYEHPMAGQEVWPSMQQALKLAGLEGVLGYPVKNNRTSADGKPYTGALFQYEGDGVYDPHALYTQRDEVKYQYGCFLSTFLATGVATVPAPAPLGTPCPQ